MLSLMDGDWRDGDVATGHSDFESDCCLPSVVLTVSCNTLFEFEQKPKPYFIV